MLRGLFVCQAYGATRSKPMPSSFLKRHRTICNVLEALRAIASNPTAPDAIVYNAQINLLVDEAKDYAQRMSKKLVERKREVKELERIIKDLSIRDIDNHHP